MSSQKPKPGKVLVVDDEPEVHQVTRLVLGNFRFADRPLELLSAYSSIEAEALMREHSHQASLYLGAQAAPAASAPSPDNSVVR